MRHFRNSQAVLRPIDGKPGHYRIEEPLIFFTSDDTTITVPAGFETDLASVPRFFWRIIPPFGRYTAAAIVHDYLCRRIPRNYKYADRIFLEAMEALHVPRWKRYTMYYAVRVAHLGK